jgi:hypothetical protein
MSTLEMPAEIKGIRNIRAERSESNFGGTYMPYAIRRKQSEHGDMWLSWQTPSQLGFKHGTKKLAAFPNRDDAKTAVLSYVDSYFNDEGYFEIVQWDGEKELAADSTNIEKLNASQTGR